MSEPTDREAPAAVGASTLTAGMMLRQARQAQGLHIAALAASIKVPQHKLELLEADRLDELPDATFVRALAQTVCRVLKIDAAPVLSRLPENAAQRLDRMNAGLGQPFRDRSGRDDGIDLSVLRHPAAWGTGLLALAAAALFFVPAEWTRWARPATPAPVASRPPASSPAAPVADASAPVGTLATEPVAFASAAAPASSPAPTASSPGGVASAPIGTAMASGVAAVDAAPTGALILRATADSWIEVVDAQGKPLVSRVLRGGEALGLDGVPPLRIKVGNAAVTQMSYRGQVVDLSAATRDNVARLELK